MVVGLEGGTKEREDDVSFEGCRPFLDTARPLSASLSERLCGYPSLGERGGSLTIATFFCPTNDSRCLLSIVSRWSVATMDNDSQSYEIRKSPPRPFTTTRGQSKLNIRPEPKQLSHSFTLLCAHVRLDMPHIQTEVPRLPHWARIRSPRQPRPFYSTFVSPKHRLSTARTQDVLLSLSPSLYSEPELIVAAMAA